MYYLVLKYLSSFLSYWLDVPVCHIQHHVLVNSVSANLDMSRGQVSKALLEVGGPEIQQELKTSFPKGISTGDVAVSGGGKLMCKQLFHTCLPEEKDGEKIQKVSV